MIEEEDVGWCVRPGCPEDLLAAIKNAIDQRREWPNMGKRGRHAAETKYSLEAALEKYRQAL